MKSENELKPITKYKISRFDRFGPIIIVTNAKSLLKKLKEIQMYDAEGIAKGDYKITMPNGQYVTSAEIKGEEILR